MSFSRPKVLSEAQLTSMRFHLGELNKIALFEDKETPKVELPAKQELTKIEKHHSPFKWMFAMMLLFLFIFALVMAGIFMYLKAVA